MSGETVLSVHRPGPLNRAIRGMLHLQGADALPDAELLHRYAAQHDEAAFAELVRRHGPMVLRVCRRVQGDTDQAQDSFQAVFIILARKAGDLDSKSFNPGWLHTAAWRIAIRAKRNSFDRQKRERPLDEATEAMAARHPGACQGSNDFRPVLDEELARLPEKYRSALVLHYLEGKSAEEVARLLGRPRNTALCWLDRGREKLRGRLAKRGLALSTSTIAAALAETTAPAAVPFASLQVLLPADLGGKSVVREGAARLVQEALWNMFGSKVRWVGILAASLLLLGFGAATWKGTAWSQKPVGNPKALAAQEEDFHVCWRFNDGKPKDIRVFEGDWHHHPGKPAVMLAPEKTFVGLVLPTRIPRRPFLLAIKMSERQVQIPPSERLTAPLQWRWGTDVFWANEQGEVVCPKTKLVCRNVEFDKPGKKLGDRACWYWMDRWWIQTTPREVVRVVKFPKPYPSHTIALRLKNFSVEEIELRSLRIDESRKVAQVIRHLERIFPNKNP
jgi:RNA polymerase sigma factor (sigma-70 family)